MAKVLLLNKPYDVLCQFTDSESRLTLAKYLFDPKFKNYYPAGRLDRDSEGLLALTDNGLLQNQIASPKHKLPKTYWAQVEGLPTQESINKLCSGVELKDGKTRPAEVRSIEEPQLWPRSPPIRERKNISTQWLEITLKEGKNRQVRRMTASVGHPTLRLIRVQIGPWHILDLQPGEYRLEEVEAPKENFRKQWKNRK